ncbi:TPA: hypothetical protein ACWX1I_003240 [Elizabethkingia anophelis]
MGDYNRIIRLKIPRSNSHLKKDYKPQKDKKEYSIAVSSAIVIDMILLTYKYQKTSMLKTATLLL